VDTHTAGEPTRIAIRGMPVLRGETLLERRDHFRDKFDELRQALLWEPRGHRDMFGAILTTPTNGADLAAIFMDADGYLNMCIHGSIGVLTAALELGLVLPRGRRSEYTLETPAGIVPVRAKIRDGRVEEITVRNVASFLWAADTPLKIPRLGSITIDVAYAGNWFALVAQQQVGIDLGQTPLRKVIEIGRKILAQARRQILIDSGMAPSPHRIDLVEIYADMHTPHGGKRHRNIVIFGNGQYDRSPCGTGTCARMAALYARGELKLNEPFLSESVNGGVFSGTVRSQLKVGQQRAVLPEVTGRAWVTGFTRVVIDPRDPLGNGFLAAID
jgi:proline racemase/trans-L-3-hydroxyproline dehydratase